MDARFTCGREEFHQRLDWASKQQSMEAIEPFVLAPPIIKP